jgi:hypothetical protein
MLRVRWKPAVAALAFAVAIASMAEGSPIRHFRPSIETKTSEASGLVVMAHGSHSACRYGRYGKSKEWHRHDGGAVYRCAPPQRFGPSSNSRQGSSGQRTGPTPIPGPKPQKTAPTPVPKRR